jgi:glutamate/tyrosine decarboxylase-like PLP-dependent enzyme
MDWIIDAFAGMAKDYLKALDGRSVFPRRDDLERLRALDVPLQEHALDPRDVLEELHELGSPATVASAGGRYFGFVIGGALPAPLGANLLAGVWDQNAVGEVSSPVASFVETVCRGWLVDLLGLPPGTEAGFVTGATMANLTCLAAARHALLERRGWDVERDGLFAAPPLRVVVGEEVHVSILKALSLLGLGRDRVVRVPVDAQGRMRAEALPASLEPTIVCAQAGNVNTGAFDPLDAICDVAAATGAWVHVDGAFGLWAAASPRHAHLCAGLPRADSWATDAHKWLNVPYDSGIAFVREPRHLLAAMATEAAYLVAGERREPFRHVPELSRRARGLEIWAALRSLGRRGLADLIASRCRLASAFAERLTRAGHRVLNDVLLNQVLVDFGDAETTGRVIRRIQEDGTCWCGGTTWQGRTAMRISVSSWRTAETDVAASCDAILRIAGEECGGSAGA